MESLLPLIDAAFTPNLQRYGFSTTRLEQAEVPFYTDLAAYANAERIVSVSYAQTREQCCDVSIYGFGEPKQIRLARYRAIPPAGRLLASPILVQGVL